MGKQIRQPALGTDEVRFIDLPSQRRVLDQITQNILFGEATLIVGERGTGKTLVAQRAAEMLGLKLEVFHFGGLFDPEAAILGSQGLENGNTRFLVSRFVRAIGTPETLILIDELNRAPMEATNALLSVIDFQKRLVIDLVDGGRIVECAPGVAFVATANLGAAYVGAQALDAALGDRLTTLRLGWPEDEEELLRPLGLSRAQARQLVKVARLIREQHAKGALPAPMTTRRLVYAAKLVKHGVALREAIERNYPCYSDECVAALRAVLAVVH